MNIDKSRFLLLFSYIGTKYSGVQRQTTRKPKNQVNPTDNTVQYYIEEALETINPKPSQEAKVSLSSRTDKGVHAFENSAVIKIVHPNSTESYYPNQIIETANTYFKTHNHDIKFNKIHLVSPEFHFRKHIKQRSYYYRLAVVKPEIANQAFFQPESYLPINELNRCSLLRTPINLDLDLMKETVQSFIGTHDFTNFAAFSKSLTYYYDGYFTRTIDQLTLTQCDLEPLEAIDPSYRNINLYEFKITSRAFLYRQIRRMIGSIIMVGSRAFPIEQFKLMLDEPEKHKWVNHYFMAPADGLYLAEIKYDPKDFLNPTNVKQLYYSGNLGPVPVNDEKESDDGFDEKEVEEDFDEDQQQFNDDKQDETFKFF